MKFLTVVVLLTAFLSHAAAAERLPGQSDPRLRVALGTWLSNESDDYRDFLALAEEGNTASLVFLVGTAREFHQPGSNSFHALMKNLGFSEGTDLQAFVNALMPFYTDRTELASALILAYAPERSWPPKTVGTWTRCCRP